ncbi:M23 family metallopeptidase [Reinekea sp. G2M2-21]|uniref:M23 family metallopeptidase n=1 Tax=Reinekea sp. G2M2-21 TaxID=2788942 RepID=UPI0018AC1AF3|nr:M23 family metallopeptidase [Reinekea sp. G2M2-21]
MLSLKACADRAQYMKLSFLAQILFATILVFHSLQSHADYTETDAEYIESVFTRKFELGSRCAMIQFPIASLPLNNSQFFIDKLSGQYLAQRYGVYKAHWGVDISASGDKLAALINQSSPARENSIPVSAIADGRVVYSELNDDPPQDGLFLNKFTGYTLVLDHGGCLSLYSHLATPPVDKDGNKLKADCDNTSNCRSTVSQSETIGYLLLKGANSNLPEDIRDQAMRVNPSGQIECLAPTGNIARVRGERSVHLHFAIIDSYAPLKVQPTNIFREALGVRRPNQTLDSTQKFLEPRLILGDGVYVEREASTKDFIHCKPIIPSLEPSFEGVLNDHFGVYVKSPKDLPIYRSLASGSSSLERTKIASLLITGLDMTVQSYEQINSIAPESSEFINIDSFDDIELKTESFAMLTQQLTHELDLPIGFINSIRNELDGLNCIQIDEACELLYMDYASSRITEYTLKVAINTEAGQKVNEVMTQYTQIQKNIERVSAGFSDSYNAIALAKGTRATLQGVASFSTNVSSAIQLANDELGKTLGEDTRKTLQKISNNANKVSSAINTGMQLYSMFSGGGALTVTGVIMPSTPPTDPVVLETLNTISNQLRDIDSKLLAVAESVLELHEKTDLVLENQKRIETKIDQLALKVDDVFSALNQNDQKQIDLLADIKLSQIVNLDRDDSNCSNAFGSILKLAPLYEGEQWMIEFLLSGAYRNEVFRIETLKRTRGQKQEFEACISDGINSYLADVGCGVSVLSSTSVAVQDRLKVRIKELFPNNLQNDKHVNHLMSLGIPGGLSDQDSISVNSQRVESCWPLSRAKSSEYFKTVSKAVGTHIDIERLLEAISLHIALNAYYVVPSLDSNDEEFMNERTTWTINNDSQRLIYLLKLALVQEALLTGGFPADDKNMNAILNDDLSSYSFTALLNVGEYMSKQIRPGLFELLTTCEFEEANHIHYSNCAKIVVNALNYCGEGKGCLGWRFVSADKTPVRRCVFSSDIREMNTSGYLFFVKEITNDNGSYICLPVPKYSMKHSYYQTQEQRMLLNALMKLDSFDKWMKTDVSMQLN